MNMDTIRLDFERRLRKLVEFVDSPFSRQKNKPAYIQTFSYY